MHLNIEEKHIRVGFFDNFRGEDTVLISVDIYGLLELEQLFEKLSNGYLYFEFKNLNYLDENNKLNIAAKSSDYNCGLIEKTPNNYEWNVTMDKWKSFQTKARIMYHNSDMGHQYLDSNSQLNTDYQVILSLNEYPLSFWEKHK